MSVRVVRQSKFRHVFGSAAKKEQCYDGIRITKSNWEGSTYCSVNPKFIAIIVESAGGGAFVVIPVHKVGRIERDCPVVGGHKADVLDLKWCPHHDEVIASCSEDCTVKIWQIPEDGLKQSLYEPIVDLVYHQRRVGLIEWHPTASNILVSAGADPKICLWDVGTGEVLAELDLSDILFSISFNYDGSKLVSACKDRKVRIHDSRTLAVIKEEQAHEGTKASQAAFVNDDRVFTTGFSKMSDRQFCIWAKDGEHSIGSGDGPLVREDIDTSNGAVFIFYDCDTNMVYLAGKGDSVIRYFEVVEEAPYVYWLSNFASNVPQRGIGFMPKRGVNVNNCEVARFYKLAAGGKSQGGYCEPLSFTVPRKSELYQDDLYPDTFSGEASVTSEEWFSGKDAAPKLMSMREMFDDGGKQKAKVRSSILTTEKKKPVAKTKSPEPETSKSSSKSGSPAPASAPTNMTYQYESFQELKSEIEEITNTLSAYNHRITFLEQKALDLDIGSAV